MAGISKGIVRIMGIAVFLAILGAGGASAAPGDDSDIGGFRGIVTRAKHLIVKILDELGVPRP